MLNISSKNTKQFRIKAWLLMTFLLSSKLFAQELYDITFEDKSFKAGIHASPNGTGIFYRNSVPVKGKKFRVFDISLTGVRSVKEKTILNQRMFNPSPYVFGKINRLYALRPMIGLQKTVAERQSKNSIGVNVFALGGISLGMVKPIFVDVEAVDPNTPNAFYTLSMRYNPSTINKDKIYGYSSFDKGIGQTKPQLGLSLKAGADFNWGYYNSDFRSLEIGVLLDYFPARPEIMYGIKNKVVYSSFYISFALGKNY
ncbi:MAG: hypothetical protein ACKOXF_08820 [Chitinophagaceae bacterium]